ncbi:MAG TPA: HdeD family acid-resistance protein [Bradyrhizobium sp.]|nr:HdeD family acid-resistance protein [Bradyrhizobium sp.]
MWGANKSRPQSSQPVGVQVASANERRLNSSPLIWSPPMSLSGSTLTEVQRAVRQSVSLHWHLFAVQGAVMTILGIVAIVWPEVSTVAVDLYVGWLFLISGAVGIVGMFFAPTVSAFLWSFLTSALSLLVGVLLLWHPVEGAASLTLVLVAFFLVEGVFQIALSLSYRDVFPESWGWMLFSGITDLILVAIILMGWPTSAGWALGLVVGANLITSGVATLVAAFAARRIVGMVERRA